MKSCPYILNGSFDEHEGAHCELIDGHDGKHRAHSLGKTVTWPSTRSRRVVDLELAVDPSRSIPKSSPAVPANRRLGKESKQ